MTYISRTCINCRKVFQIKTSRVKYGEGKYCSRLCRTVYKSLLVTCSNCKKEFSIYLSRFKSSKKYVYCSRTCMGKHRKELGVRPPLFWLGKKRPAHSIRMSGKNSPFWKGGRFLQNGYWLVLIPKHPFADRTQVDNGKTIRKIFKSC